MLSPLVMLAVFLGAAAMSALATGLALNPLRKLAGLQHVREDVPESHQAKAGTPSMGGIPMLAAIVVSAVAAGFATGQLCSRLVLALALMVCYALVGLADDWRKLGDKRSKGIPARYRLGAEVAVALLFIAGLSAQALEPAGPGWVGTAAWPPALAAALGVFVIVGGANAMNLTDGLDGLASGLTAIAAVAFSAVALGLGHRDMAVFSLVVAGSAAGFLAHNAKPAKVWMGDVGSLGLGAALAGIAVAARIEFLYAIIGFVFAAEALSVILQVASFKRTGKRIFRMAPLHHHFELCGRSEQQVVGGFWFVGLCLAAAGLALFWATTPLG
jgi:phospho-N-acetylmuramoyl-pentapeptide-transferase